MSLSPLQTYLFDVQGALVVPGVLSPDEVARLNAAIDEQEQRRTSFGDSTDGADALAGDRPREGYTDPLEWEQPWCEPFRDLMAHPRLVSYLDDLLGRGWHLDHRPEIFDFGPGAQGQRLHFGNHWEVAGIWYRATAGAIRNALVVAEFVLTPQPEGQGGFCFVPGSHKAAFPRPEEITALDPSVRHAVANPGAEPGDVILFTEAVCHGAMPWTNDWRRRLVIHRYAAKTVQYGPGFHAVRLPDWIDELTPAQRAAIQPAHFYDRPAAVADGRAEILPADYDEPGVTPSVADEPRPGWSPPTIP